MVGCDPQTWFEVRTRSFCADVRRELATTIVRGGWGLLELRPVRVSLEDIFLSLTTEEVATAEPADLSADTSATTEATEVRGA